MRGRVLASERVVLGASTLTLALTLASWSLMRFGAYTFGRAVSVSLLASAVLALLAWRLRVREPAPKEPWHWLALAAVLCLAFGGLYAAYPTYFLFGGQDPGPYLAFGARIANTGGLDLRVPEFQRWAHAHPPGLFRSFPAVYGDMGSPDADALHPQFVHLYTAYMANFWATHGLEGAVRANAWVGVLCLATGCVFLRRLGSLPAAFAFVLALGLSPAFVWASRITMTEVVALWLNLLGLLLLLLAWEAESFGLGAAGAAVLGIGVLNRLDGGLGSFALLGFAAATLAERGRRPRIAALAALVHGVLIAFGYFDGERLAPDYFRDLNRISGGTVYKLIALTLAVDVVAFIVALIPERFKQKLWLNETSLRLGGYGVVTLLAVWAAYGFTLRPFGSDPETATTFFELSWYVGLVAWPLCLVGFGLGLGPRSFQLILPLLLFTAGTLYIYTSRTDVFHAHIWASRRWVPHVIPFVLAGAALGFEPVLRALRRLTRRFGARASRVAVAAGGLVLAAAWLAPLVSFSRPFLLRSMLEGLPRSYERVAEYARQHRDRWPLLTGTVQLGSILTYGYGVPTLVLNERGCHEAEQELAFVGEMGVGFTPFDLRNGTLVDAHVSGKYLESTASEPPKNLITMRLPLELGVFGTNVFDYQVRASHPALRSRDCSEQPDGSLVSKGRNGPMLWGPGIDLGTGRYRVAWYGSTKPGSEEERGTLAVVDDVHPEPLTEIPLWALDDDPSERLLGQLDFTLTEPTRGVDFRVTVQRKSGVRIARLRFQRFGP